MGRIKHDNITFGVTKRSLINDLMAIKDKCIEENQTGNALKAIALVANLIGYANGGDPYKLIEQNNKKQLNAEKIQVNLFSSSDNIKDKNIIQIGEAQDISYNENTDEPTNDLIIEEMNTSEQSNN
jgi:hypothetical protein